MTIQVFGPDVQHYLHTLRIGLQEELLQTAWLKVLSMEQNFSMIQSIKTKY